MIKRMFVEVWVKPGHKIVVEMEMKGDGINALHTYNDCDHEEYSEPDVQILWENEEGDRNHILQECIRGKEAYLRVLNDNTFFPERNMHMWEHTAWRKQFFPPDTAGYKMYDETSPFFLHGIGTAGNIISQEEADNLAKDIVDGLSGRNYVEEYELNHLGHVYGLSNGEALIIRGNGTWYFSGDFEQLEGKVEEVVIDIDDDEEYVLEDDELEAVKELVNSDDTPPEPKAIDTATFYGDDAYDH